MRLLEDDRLQVYVWVDDEDETIHISPHFDYEEDALQWRQQTPDYEVSMPHGQL